MNAWSKFVVPIFSVTLVLMLGCAHEPKTARANAPVRTTSAVVSAPKSNAQPPFAANVAHDAPMSSLSVSPQLIEACAIHFDNVDTTPKFDFDQSALRPAETQVLDQIAKCLISGPLKGREIRLVGRADPRGEQEYNFALGENRADAVENYLLDLGVAPHQVSETSRGKLDATGTDETGWQLDRRVDVLLQK